MIRDLMALSVQRASERERAGHRTQSNG